MRGAAILLAGLVLAAVAGAQVRELERINVGGDNSPAPGAVDGLGLAAHGDRFVAVWTEQGGTSAHTQDIHASVSFDQGHTWTAPARVDLGDPPHASDSELPKVAIAADGAVVVVWEEGRAGGTLGERDLFHNRSTDGGLTWMPQALALNTPTAGAHLSSDVDRAWIAASGNSFHVVWEEDSLHGLFGPEELWYTSSGDSGASWTLPRVISSTSIFQDVDDPKVAASGDRVVVAYVTDTYGDDDVHALVSSDGGASFSPRALESSTPGDADSPMIAIEGPLVAVAWIDDDPALPGGDAVHVAVSSDGGQSWGPERVVSVRAAATAGARALWHDVAVAAGHVHVVYSDDAVSVAAGGPSAQAGAAVYAATSADGGASWTVDVPLHGGTTPSHRPAVAATPSTVFVQMETGTNGVNRLAYALSRDHGASWQPAIAAASPGGDVDSDERNEGRAFAASALADVALGLVWENSTGANEAWLSGIDEDPAIYRTCAAGPNSTGAPATLTADGSPFLAKDALTLVAGHLPDQLGLFFCGPTGTEIPFGNGVLCITGGVTFLYPPLVASGNQLALPLAPATMGLPPGPRHFQLWFRDPLAGGSFWDTSDGLCVVFQ